MGLIIDENPGADAVANNARSAPAKGAKFYSTDGTNANATAANSANRQNAAIIH